MATRQAAMATSYSYLHYASLLATEQAHRIMDAFANGRGRATYVQRVLRPHAFCLFRNKKSRDINGTLERWRWFRVLVCYLVLRREGDGQSILIGVTAREAWDAIAYVYSKQ